MARRFYISTAIHYVNDLPHIGHIYENIVADTMARYRRMIGDDVFFLTGTDEHGQKIQRAAVKEGVLPIELADRVVQHHLELDKRLGIHYDDFIRTTESRHRIAVYELIRRIQEGNPDDLYLGEHKGWYCSTEESFFPETQIADGRCEEGHPVEWTTERNYFFRLSKYERALLDLYDRNPEFVHPRTRFNEIRSFVQSGLRDLSVSRTSITWGIPWPGNPEHVIYVWLDALTNYISALGFGTAEDERFRNYWPADAHLIGKDITRFHAVYWPAFLMAAGIEVPKRIVTHGWWLRDNQKISKSTGNIVRPTYLIDAFGPDPLRYYLMREMTFGQDAQYSDESFLQRYNADLANDLGNTLSRVVKMSDSYFEGKTPPVPCNDNDVMRAAEQLIPEYRRDMDHWELQRALDSVWKLLEAINGYIVRREPWKMVKEQGTGESLSRVIWNCLEGIRIVWTMMAPFMPHLTPEALRRIGAGEAKLDADALDWGSLGNGVPVTVGEALFPRIDTQAWLAAPEPREEAMDEETKSADPQSVSRETPLPETTEAITPDAHRISIDQFFEVDLRVAEVISAKRIERSNKLLELRVSTGDSERTLVAGIAREYEPEELTGRKVVIVANLQPARLMGVESNGMVLAASIDGRPSLLSVDPSVPPGTKVR